MAFNFTATGTIAELETAMSVPPTTPPTDAEVDLRAAAFNFIQAVWDEGANVVYNTVLNGELELKMHGKSDEKGIRFEMIVNVVKVANGQVSGASLPAQTFNGATS